ncbi:MAG: 2-C-methyl-D-erythritol 4-phosphate cytidylyltransferase [Oscillospiraceae bacterium]|jgi:2-C-methyl-D-erythritol 4-phosphate cytidylyltransferase|nr:2-C-methyl-D-erythritol 4-phosphate cytidylyltransferase [Oscillospiraceae bacterium]MCI8714188.1 2-C-methyl-D-erythritol 4-phosphate cytidylyltransferase [Oscillospiraceae bacterium]MCI9316500.1 2-C-methyl-D-erythritol 4-phosphate cytidylyltransferase [Oscillospiraceae bacterium]MDE6934438.1 2-C-methyl-D-erythritol 4-phosphate cytidylyltransferase [Oscillospiraceae bacterium]
MKKLFSKLFHKKKKEAHPFCSAIVAAAGSSRRMEGENKLLLPLDGIPVLARTLMALNGAELVDEIVVAVREEDLLPTGDLCRIYGVSKPVKIVRGGETRLASVLAASLECREDAAFLAVHDGARPLADPALIDRVVALAHRTNAAAPAVPVKDTIKVIRDNVVVSTPPREELRAIQTPQVFDAQLLRAALQAAAASGVEVTDDCSAVERLGKEVYLTEGSYENLKITTPEDLLLAEGLLRRREGSL